MPTYEYECLKCGEVFEVFQSIKDKPLKKHSECGGRLKKLISSGVGIIFKGSGFYATDYKKRPSPPAELKKDADKSSEAKADAKPSTEKKTESKKKE